MVVHFARTTLQPDKIPHKSGAGSNRVSLDGRAFRTGTPNNMPSSGSIQSYSKPVSAITAKRKQADVDYLITKINDNSYAQIVERWRFKNRYEGIRDTVSFRLLEQHSELFSLLFQLTVVTQIALPSTLSQEILTQNINIEVSAEHSYAMTKTLFDAIEKLPKTHAFSARKLQLKDNAHRFRRKGLIPKRNRRNCSQ